MPCIPFVLTQSCLFCLFGAAENGMAVLFSNDQNLCSKALINGVKAFNHQVSRKLLD